MRRNMSRNLDLYKYLWQAVYEMNPNGHYLCDYIIPLSIWGIIVFSKWQIINCSFSLSEDCTSTQSFCFISEIASIMFFGSMYRVYQVMSYSRCYAIVEFIQHPHRVLVPINHYLYIMFLSSSQYKYQLFLFLARFI